MKKILVALLTLCLSCCALALSACEETPVTPTPPESNLPSTPENSPPTDETPSKEEIETTYTTDFVMGSICGLLTTEYYGNQIQNEVYLSTLDGWGYRWEYGYNEHGVLETFNWIDCEHLYALPADDPDYDSCFFTLEQDKNGIFAGATVENDVRVVIELYENGTIKKRELIFSNPYEGEYAIGAEFDERGRRITTYEIGADNSYGIICQYSYEGDSPISTSCDITAIEDGEEISLNSTITRENGLLSSVQLDSEFTSMEFTYLPNGYFASATGTHFAGNIHTLNFTYNDKGLVSKVVEKVTGQDGWEETYTYNDEGLETSFEYITYNLDGSIRSKRTISYEYDTNNVLSKKTVTEYGSNGEILSCITYDENGNIITE